MHLASHRSLVPASPHSIPTVRVATCLSVSSCGGCEHRLWVCISVPQSLFRDAGNSLPSVDHLLLI